jgi:hypothetical protein
VTVLDTNEFIAANPGPAIKLFTLTKTLAIDVNRHGNLVLDELFKKGLHAMLKLEVSLRSVKWDNRKKVDFCAIGPLEWIAKVGKVGNH